MTKQISTYAFVLGKNPQLSNAEIKALFPQARLEFGLEVTLMHTTADFNQQTLDQLGGTIKIIKILTELPRVTPERLLPYLTALDGKIKFGLSKYLQQPLLSKHKIHLPSLGQTIKKLLKTRERSARFITAKTPNLSAVVVKKNRLLDHGLELCLIETQKHFLLGKTIAVQNFENYSKRDYGRPERDDKSGMLPPKLAQILINLAGPERDGSLLDPFCGSGTIIQEAALLGYQRLTGTDLNAKAITDSEKNWQWLQTAFSQTKSVQPQLLQADIRDLNAKIPTQKFDRIIFEGYLGPTLPQKHQISKILFELTKLYQQTFRICAQLLTKNGTIVAALPAWHYPEHTYHLNIKQIIPTTLRQIHILPNTTLIYSRTHQTVQREIIVLRKK